MPKLPPIVPNGPDPPISESPGSWTKWEVPVTVMVPKLVVVALPVLDTCVRTPVALGALTVTVP